jgi:hypothetical protein
MNGREWMAKVGALPCVLCAHCGVEQEGRTTVHHIRAGQGKSQRASDFATVALCWDHHQGNSGVEKLGPGGLFQRYRVDEIRLLELTIEAVAKGL